MADAPRIRLRIKGNLLNHIPGTTTYCNSPARVDVSSVISIPYTDLVQEPIWATTPELHILMQSCKPTDVHQLAEQP